MAATRRTSIERILCPIDFSDISHHALAHAAAVARWYEARLTLLYVFVNLPALDLPPLVLEDGDRARLFGQMRAFADIVRPEVQVDCQLQEAAAGARRDPRAGGRHSGGPVGARHARTLRLSAALPWLGH